MKHIRKNWRRFAAVLLLSLIHISGILAIANSDQENIAKLVTTESGDMTLFEDLCTSMTTDVYKRQDECRCR